jgi:hypothetical protein
VVKIRYTLHEYHFNGGKTYRARVKYGRVVDLEGVIDDMNLPFSGLTRAVVVAILAEFARVILRLLLDGCKVVTPFGEFGLTIKGEFKDTLARFDGRKQHFEIKIKPEAWMQGQVKARARAQQVEARQRRPHLQTVLNMADESAQGILTPGEMVQVYGYDLKFDQADPRQGIFLLPVKADGRFKPAGAPVRIERIGYNKGRKLVFIVPADLPPGAYLLEVCVRIGRSTLRRGQFREVLHVLEAKA